MSTDELIEEKPKSKLKKSSKKAAVEEAVEDKPKSKANNASDKATSKKRRYSTGMLTK